MDFDFDDDVDIPEDSEDFEAHTAANFSDKKILRVMRAVATKKAAYISEIKHHTGLTHDTVRAILYDLERVGVMERLNPQLKNSDERLLSRIPEINAEDVEGIQEFKNMKWFALNSDMEWYLWPRQADYWVDEYHQRVDKPPETEPSIEKVKKKLQQLEERRRV